MLRERRRNGGGNPSSRAGARESGLRLFLAIALLLTLRIARWIRSAATVNVPLLSVRL